MMKYSKSLYPFTPKQIEIKGQQIHYIDEGNGQIILFSHAAIGSSFMYRELIKTLSQSYRCIALDYPGFGLSLGKPQQSFSIESQSIVLEHFILALGLSDILALGHDTGGPSLLAFSCKYPHLFDGLILTDTLPFPTWEYPRIHLMLWILGSKFFQKLNIWTNFILKATLRFGVFTRKLEREEIKQYMTLYKDKVRRKHMTTVLKSLREQSELMEKIKSSLENKIKNIPTLLIYGAKDPLSHMGIPSRIHEMVNNSELHFIKDEGHFPHEGQARKMSEIIHRWAKSLARTRLLT